MRCVHRRVCGAPAARPLQVQRPRHALRSEPTTVARARTAAAPTAPDATEKKQWRPKKKRPRGKMAAANLGEQPEKAKAVIKYQRGSPSKYRRVLDAIKGKTYEEALTLLTFSPYKASEKILEALMSAGQNAKQQFGMRKSRLFVKVATCDEGPTLKRFQPRAQGRAYRIRKRTSHVTVAVQELKEEEIQARREKRTRNKERRELTLDPDEGAIERPPERERPVVTAEDEAAAVEEKIEAVAPDPDEVYKREDDDEDGEEGDGGGEEEPDAEDKDKKA